MHNYSTNRSLTSSLSPKIPNFPRKPVQTNQLAAIPCRLKNPCQGCGGSQGIVTVVDRSSGNPHHYRLDCRDCGRFQRWVGQREFDRKIGKQGGRENA
jgi:hypothetical protein